MIGGKSKKKKNSLLIDEIELSFDTQICTMRISRGDTNISSILHYFCDDLWPCFIWGRLDDENYLSKQQILSHLAASTFSAVCISCWLQRFGSAVPLPQMKTYYWH